MPVSSKRFPATAQRGRTPEIACFGEALWDILPRGIFLGGAPLNVAYHLSRQGVNPLPVSAVGDDFLGNEALHRIKSWGISPHFIQRRAPVPTGTVRASLDARGVATYQIMRGVAWDSIEVAPPLLRRSAPVAIVFGTLALRSRTNQRSLARLFEAWPSAFRVLDLNLRSPFDRGPAIDWALRHAQILKLNAEELALCTARTARSPTQLAEAARRLGATSKIAKLCVTAGDQGAGVLWEGEWCWEPGRRVAVRDTVGAGDAFLAAFLGALLVRKKSAPLALRAACRMGEFVASCDGATPPYDCDEQGRPRDVRSLNH